MSISFFAKFAQTLVRVLGFGVALTVAVPAYAVCPAANQFNFNFSSQATASLSYAGSYTFTATNGLGQTQPFTVSFTNIGQASNLNGTLALPAISNVFNGGGTVNALDIGGQQSTRTTNIFSATNVIVTTFAFATPVRDITIAVHDVDFSINSFRDWVAFVGRNGAATYVPSISTPFGTNNAAGPRTNPSSSALLGTSTTPVAVGISEAVGIGGSANQSTTGNVTASFQQPVLSLDLRYGTYPLQTGETVTSAQGLGISTISFCPMPRLTFTKTSAPYITAATDPRRFNTPGSDVIYSLTVKNSDTSPIDLNQTILTDPLPAQISFYNGDIDDAGPLTTNFEFLPETSSLTMTAANLTYSNNGGASYVYTPAAGYDALVNAIRLNPQGTLAAGASFQVRFRAQIK